VGCSHTIHLGPQAPPERWQKAQRRLEGRKAEVVLWDGRQFQADGVEVSPEAVVGWEVGSGTRHSAPPGRGGHLLSGAGPGRSGGSRPGCAGRGRRNSPRYSRRLFGFGRRVPRLDDCGRDSRSCYRPSGWAGHWRSSGKSNLRSVRFGWVAVKAPARAVEVCRTSSGTRPPSSSTPPIGTGPSGWSRPHSATLSPTQSHVVPLSSHMWFHMGNYVMWKHVELCDTHIETRGPKVIRIK